MIKQVPATQNVLIDETTGVLLRAGVKSKFNPYDLFALELALELREARGGEVVLLTMGPPQAKKALEEGLRMGADRGVLLCDARFAGSDVLATSRALSQAIIASGGADLILTGRQTTDGDTAQVGPEVAGFLDIPHACGVYAVNDMRILTRDGIGGNDDIVERENVGGRLTVSQRLGDSLFELELDMPCLLAVDKDINTPRLPSYLRGKTLGDSPPVSTLTLGDLAERDERLYGIAGSPTSVVKVFPPPPGTERVTYEGEGPELGRRLAELLISQKFVER